MNLVHEFELNPAFLSTNSTPGDGVLGMVINIQSDLAGGEFLSGDHVADVGEAHAAALGDLVELRLDRLVHGSKHLMKIDVSQYEKHQQPDNHRQNASNQRCFYCGVILINQIFINFLDIFWIVSFLSTNSLTGVNSFCTLEFMGSGLLRLL